MLFMQAAFVYTVASYRMCAHTFHFNDASHKRERVSYMCVYKFNILPHHQKFSSYGPGGPLFLLVFVSHPIPSAL